MARTTNKPIAFRFTEEDVEIMDQLASLLRRTRTDTIRVLAREKYEELTREESQQPVAA